MKLPKDYLSWLLANQVGALLAVVIATVPCIYILSKAPMATSMVEMFMANTASYRHYVERAALLGGDTDAIIYVATDEGDQLFTPATLNRIRYVAKQIEDLPEVDHVVALTDSVRTTSGGPAAVKTVAAKTAIRRKLLRGEVPTSQRSPPVYWPYTRTKQNMVDLAEMKSRMMEDPLLVRTLLAADGRGQAMMVQLHDPNQLLPRQQYQLVHKLEDVVRQGHLGRDGVFTSGVIIAQGWTYEQINEATHVLLPIGVAMIFAVVYLLLRKMRLVLLTLAIALIAILWAMGTAVFVFGTMTVLLAAVPLMVLVISTSDTIHLTSAYLAEREAGRSHEDALHNMTTEVGGACVLTSVTTFVGFISLLVIPSATTRHYALASAVGVASALLLALVFVPIALDYLRPEPIGHPVGPKAPRRKMLAHAIIDYFLRTCEWLSLSFPVVIFCFSIVGSLGILWSCRDLKMDPDLITRFAPSHSIRGSAEYFDRQFAGNTSLEIFLTAPTETLLATDTLQAVARLEEVCRQLPTVTATYSVNALLQLGNREIGFETEDGLPPNIGVTRAYLDFLHQNEPYVVDSVVNRDQGLMRILVRTSHSSFIAAKDLAGEVVATARQILPHTIQVDAAGSSAILGDAVEKIVRGQYQGFVLCFVVVMFTIAWGLNSTRLGLIGILPNVMPLVLLAGALRWSGPRTDTDILGVAILSLGLAVDDTIHFLHRYIVERRRSESSRVAIEATFRYTGRAILRTTLILVLGFLPFAISSYFSFWILGTYLVLVLGAAVLGDLILLPAMIQLFDRPNE